MNKSFCFCKNSDLITIQLVNISLHDKTLNTSYFLKVLQKTPSSVNSIIQVLLNFSYNLKHYYLNSVKT